MIVHAAGESSRLVPTLPGDTHVVVLAAATSTLDALPKALEAAGWAHSAVVEDGQLLAVGIAPGFRNKALKRLVSSLPLVRKAPCRACAGPCKSCQMFAEQVRDLRRTVLQRQDGIFRRAWRWLTEM